MNLAYLSRGRLFRKFGDEPARPVESRFAQEIVQRALDIQKRNEWKNAGSGARFMGRANWGAEDLDPRSLRASICAVCRGGQPGQILFALDTDVVGGVFRHEIASNGEKRLLHRENFRIRDMDRQSGTNRVAFSMATAAGVSNIVVTDDEFGPMRQATEGDSVDEAPSWYPEGNRFVFQTAGIARDPQGFASGVSNASLASIDLDSGALTTLVDDPAHDYLLPHVDRDGNLYAIRRPYEAPGAAGYPLTNFVKDTVLFPFRMARALFHYMNFFSLMYTRKPLTTAQGPDREGPDLKALLLRGRMIDAEKILRERLPADTHPALVPKSWELIRRSGSQESVLARGVVGFDLAENGAVAFTNGSSVHAIDPGGEARLVLKGDLIEHIVVLD